MKDGIKLRRKEKERFLKYISKKEPRDLFESRDKAILILFLCHDIRETEISNLDISDCRSGTLFTRQGKEPFTAFEKQAILSYLRLRIQHEQRHFPDKPALFIDYSGKRLTPASIRQVLKRCLQ